MSLATYGVTDADFSFGMEENRVMAEYYVADNANLWQVLQLLLGKVPASTNAVITPHQHPYFTNCYCTQVRGRPIDKKSVQASIYTNGYNALFNTFPKIAGGWKIKATYEPWGSPTTGPLYHVVDEEMDFQTQTMSILANSAAVDPLQAINWEYPDVGSPPAPVPCTNIKGMVRMVPKIEMFQKRLVMSSPPGIPGTGMQNSVAGLVGSVNSDTFIFGVAGQAGNLQWSPEVCLCLGMPTRLRWRFDGLPVWEVGIRIAVNLLQDTIYKYMSGNSPAGSPGAVGWNRLYDTSWGGWSKVFLGVAKKTIYPAVPFGLINYMS